MWTASSFGNATQGMLDRLSYVDFFAVVLETVPSQLPHENGALWLDAITRPFMPRLFFPSKTVIDDSERTNYYTGLGVAGAEEGTSISLGYVAESYIDFGGHIDDGTDIWPWPSFGWLLSQNACSRSTARAFGDVACHRHDLWSDLPRVEHYQGLWRFGCHCCHRMGACAIFQASAFSLAVARLATTAVRRA